MRLFQFSMFNPPVASVCWAAGGKFNGWFKRNAPLGFIVNGNVRKCAERLSRSRSDPKKAPVFQDLRRLTFVLKNKLWSVISASIGREPVGRSVKRKHQKLILL